LARRLLQGIESRQATVNVHASAEELTSLFNLAGRGLPRLTGRVEFSAQKALIATSLRLPPTALSSFLNLQLELLPSQDGLLIGHARLGRIDCSGRLALGLLRLALNLGFGLDEGPAVLDSLQSLEISDNQIHLQVRDPSRLKSRLRRLPARLARLGDLSFPLVSPWPRAKVQLYSERLQRSTDALPKSSAHLLSSYLKPLFELAQQRSIQGNPVEENQAALLALASYLGDRRIARLLDPAAAKAASRTTRPPAKVLLAGRNDLRRHFVLSAGLQLLVEQGLTAAIGEGKELLDAGSGGSGFSFADLAADRAGSALARSASDPKGARQLQRLLAASTEEANFFPSLEGLPENLSQTEFEARFGGVDNPAYLQLLQEIDRRLAQLPIHRW
jgi:hypothetical protein